MKLNLLFLLFFSHCSFFLKGQALFTTQYKFPQPAVMSSTTESVSDSSYLIAGYTSFRDSLNQFLPYPSILKTGYNGSFKSYFEYRFSSTYYKSSFISMKADYKKSNSFFCGISYDYTSSANRLSKNFIGEVEPSGNINFLKEIYFSQNDLLTSLVATMDGGMLLTGVAHAHNESAIDMRHFIVKFDSSFTQQWAKLFFDTIDCEGSGAFQLADSGFIVTGFQKDNDSTFISSNLYIMRLDKNGNVLWQKKTIGSLERVGRGAAIFTETLDSNLIIGYSSSFTSVANSYMSLLKISLSGNLIWHRFLNSSPYSIISLPDSGFILPSTVATKLDAQGNVQYSVYQNYPNYTNKIGYVGIKSSDGHIVGGGATLIGFLPHDPVVCKRDMNGYADCYNVLTPNAFSVTSGMNLTNFSLADSSLVFTENPISYVVYDSIPLVAQLCPGNTIAEPRPRGPSY